MDDRTVLRVALAGPLYELFDYLPPDAGEPGPDPGKQPDLVPGMRLLVPFGRGRRVGILVEIARETEVDPARLKPVSACLDPEPLFGPDDLQLIRWAAAYYQHPLGNALFSALPVRLRHPVALLENSVSGVRLTSAGRDVDPSAVTRAPRQRVVLEWLAAHAPREGMALGLLQAAVGECAGVLRALREKGWVESCQVHWSGASTGTDEEPLETGPELNAEQANAVRSLSDSLGRFHPVLLDGVTGSGKTEVYIRVITQVIASGRQALVIIPEIGLTPQLQARFSRRLPGIPAVLHSALNDSEREQAWRRAATGDAAVVLGTRSAVFTPMPRLGLIVVDEEQDPSLKQQEGFRYSGRDLAVRRAQLANCPVVLGSATPALETLHNARSGRYDWLHLPRRAGGASSPQISLLDIRNQPLRAGLSPFLREQVREELLAGNQILLFLNRRGYAPVLTCHSCGWVGDCPHCDAQLTLHLHQGRLWCHHCGWYETVPSVCPQCGGCDLRMLGRGTERLEEELQALFPESVIVRIDRDSTRRKGELRRLLEAVRRGEVQILLGTQMLAKGHDFPGVTLAGVIDLDHALYASDFRAPERTAQLIVQVAGRAGRAERPGRLVLQTRHPEHPLLQSLLQEGYAGFARTLLEEREAAQLPPFAYLALVRAEAAKEGVAMQYLDSLRERGETLGMAEVLLLGPVPAPMERRAGRYRAQLLVQCAQRPRLQRFLRAWVPAMRELARVRGLRWSLDVDPQDML